MRVRACVRRVSEGRDAGGDGECVAGLEERYENEGDEMVDRRGERGREREHFVPLACLQFRGR